MSKALQRLDKLRALLNNNNISAYVIPTADAHQSEYVSASDMRRAFISGFTGSAGTAIVTPNKALLWTDGRYFIQAEKELDFSCWELMKQGLENVPTMEKWLCDNLKAGDSVGIDPYLMSIVQYKKFKSTLDKKKINLKAINENLVDKIWSFDDKDEPRPQIPNNLIKVHDIKYAGQSSLDKINDLRKKMINNQAYAFVISALDEIAWLFNLRGSDISYNPVFISYAIITHDNAILYVNDSKLDDKVREHCKANNITIKPYNNVVSDLQIITTQVKSNKKDYNNNNDSNILYKIWYDPSRVNVALYNAMDGINESVNELDTILDESTNPIEDAKSKKNKSEIEGMVNSHIRDGAAVCKFLAWLENELVNLPKCDDSDEIKAKSKLNEYTAADKLEYFRSLGENFVGLSFNTISSIGPNGAIIHYAPSKTNSAPITTGKIYLLDSGGQYLDGTTDITRTVFLQRPGSVKTVDENTESDFAPTKFQKEAYTRVLIGHLRLAAQVFPVGVSGPVLDCLARSSLWEAGLDFLHGTGHGVGSYLNVHEGPIGIYGAQRGGKGVSTALSVGNVISNEPGYYHKDSFGIRIENLVHVVPKKTKYGQEGKTLGFENLTVVPMDRNLIELSIMSLTDIQLLNDYHAQVRQLVLPLLKDDELATKWLLKNTEPL